MFKFLEHQQSIMTIVLLLCTLHNDSLNNINYVFFKLKGLPMKTQEAVFSFCIKIFQSLSKVWLQIYILLEISNQSLINSPQILFHVAGGAAVCEITELKSRVTQYRSQADRPLLDYQQTWVLTQLVNIFNNKGYEDVGLLFYPNFAVFSLKI